jgi:hypothetical protein
MIEYRTGMQNGVQIVHIFIKASVWIGHVVLLCSFRFRDGKRLRKTQGDVKTSREKFFGRR